MNLTILHRWILSLVLALLTLAPVRSTAAVSFNLVKNGGFDAGPLYSQTATNWTLSGDTANFEVDDGTDWGIAPESGGYCADLGTRTNDFGYVSQTLSTVPGSNYIVSFWLNNFYQDPGVFLVSWNGSNILSLTNPVADTWTNFQFLVSATTSNTVLQFGFLNDTDVFALDSVDVESNYMVFTAIPGVGPAPLTVQFNSPSVDLGGDAVSNWFWSFGDGGTSTNQNPSYIYTNADNTNALYPTMHAVNSLGHFVPGFGPPIVPIPHTLQFTATPATGGLFLTVQFNTPSVDSYGDAVTSWSWDFNDGTTSTNQNPVHTYQLPNVFQPTLQVSNSIGGTIQATGPSINVVVYSRYPAPYAFTTVAGQAGVTGTNDGTNSGARFFSPNGVAVDAATNIYVADPGNNAIRKLTAVGTNWVVTTIAGQATVVGTNDGTNTAALFNSPEGVALDQSGNIYVADTYNYTIRKMTPVGTNWVVTTLAGHPQVEGTNDGTNAVAKFYYPEGIVVDQATNIYVADFGNSTIRKVSPVGTNWVVTTVAGLGESTGTNDGTNSAARFSSPTGLGMDAATNLYVGDTGNSTIRKITPLSTNWVVTTIAGVPASFYYNDATNTGSLFFAPQGIAVDSATNLYVVDSDNDTIRKMMPVGTNWVTTTIGGKPSFRGTNDGVGVNARFNLSKGIAVDGNDNIFVADVANQTIREGVPVATNAGTLQFTASPTNAEVPLTVQFSTPDVDNNGNAIDSWNWNFGDGSGTSTDQSPTHTYTNAGNFLPVLVASNVLGETINATGPGLISVLYPAPNTNGATVVTITSPANNFLTTTSNLTVKGTVKSASKGAPVFSLLQVTVNTNAPVPASVTGGAWSCAVSLVPGYNILTAQTVLTNSTETNLSFPVTRTVFYDVTAPVVRQKSVLTLIASPSAHGKITGQANNANLEIGKIFTVKAVPAGNWIFSNWMSGTNTNALSVLPGSATLAFDMSSNLILQANFVTNPFTAVAGTYNGLFSSSNGVSEASSGFLTATLLANGAGAYSAKLLVGGGTFPFSGSFDLSGDAQTSVTLAGQAPLTVNLHLNLAAPDDQMTGTIMSSASNGWTSELLADRAAFSKSNPASNFSGNFTLVIPPGDTAPTNEPGGYSYATMANTTAGVVSISGHLSDNTAISQSVAVSKDGNVPLYVSLYTKKGSLMGWLTLTNTASNQVAQIIEGTNLVWIKTNIAKTLYPAGFTNANLAAFGTRYTKNFVLTNGTLILSNGNLSGSLVYTNLSIVNNKLVANGTPTNKLTGVLTPATGILTLTFRPTGGHADTTARGVVLEGTNFFTNAAGGFLGTNQSGYFLLEP